MSRGPEAVGEPLGHAPEELVARGVAEGVVHRLEVVEVDEGDGDAGAVATVATMGDGHPVLEQGAVGQARERVVQAAVLQLPLELALVGDVAELAEDEADTVGVLDHRHRELAHLHGAVGAGDALVGGEAGLVTPDDRDEGLLFGGQLVGVGEALVGVGQHLGLGAAHQRAERRVHLHEAAVEGAQGHADRVVGEGVVQHPFGRGPAPLGGPAIGDVTDGEDQAAEPLVLEPVGGDQFDVGPRARARCGPGPRSVRRAGRSA